MTTQSAILPWEVFDADGRLRAAFDSETEAYFYLRNRGHMHGGTYRKLDGTPSGLLASDVRGRGEDPDEYPPRCTHPDGHKWNRTPGEADEARLSGDYENDNIRCVYCGADGDA